MNLTPYVEPLRDFLRRPILRREAIWIDRHGINVVPHPSVGMLYATRGGGKTMTALDMGLRVAAAQPWGPYSAEMPTAGSNGDERPDPRSVLFVDGEMPEADLQERLANLTAEGPLREAVPYCYLLGSDRLAALGSELNLSTERARRAVLGAVETFDIDFVVLDNWVSLMHDIDENDNAAIGPIARWLARLRHDGVSVLVVHHAGKSGRQRGASSREDVLDYSIKLTPGNRSGQWRLQWDKRRGGMPEPASFTLRYEEGELVYARSDARQPREAGARLLALLEGAPGPMRRQDIAHALEMSPRAVESLTRRLAEAGRLCRVEPPAGASSGRGTPSWWALAPPEGG